MHQQLGSRTVGRQETWTGTRFEAQGSQGSSWYGKWPTVGRKSVDRPSMASGQQSVGNGRIVSIVGASVGRRFSVPKKNQVYSKDLFRVEENKTLHMFQTVLALKVIL